MSREWKIGDRVRDTLTLHEGTVVGVEPRWLSVHWDTQTAEAAPKHYLSGEDRFRRVDPPGHLAIEAALGEETPL
jgi:hypothetical protein